MEETANIPPTPIATENTQTPQSNHRNSEILKIIIAAFCFVLGIGQILSGIMMLIFVVPQLKALQESLELTNTTNFYFVYACLFVTIILGCIIIFLGYRVLKLRLRLWHVVTTLIVVFILQGIIAGIIISSIIFPIYKTVYEVNNNLISPSPTPTPITSSLDTKTYIGKDYFFMYPEDYELLIDKKYSVDGVTASVPGTTTLVSPIVPEANTNFQLSITVEDRPLSTLLEETASALGNIGSKGTYEIDRKEVNIFKDTTIGLFGSTILYVENNNKVYSISINSSAPFAKIQKPVDQILSTLKFNN